MATAIPQYDDAAGIAHQAAGRKAPRRAEEFNLAAHGIRGLASVLVLLAHIAGGTARHIYPRDAAYESLIRNPWYFGTFGVELFFVISGFVILQSALRYSMTEFALRRFVRIYPLFFVLSFVFLILNALTNQYPHNNNLLSVVSGLTFINIFTGTEQLTPNAWSLSFEVWFYIITALIVGSTIRHRNRVMAAVSALIAVSFLIAFPITTYFLIGVLLRLGKCEQRTATAWTRAAEAASFLALVWFASRAHFDYTSWLQFANLVVPPILLATTAYFWFALQRSSLTAILLGGRVFRYCGTVSYSLYLVHPFVYYVLRMVFVRFGWFTQDVARSMTLFALAVIAGSFIVTHFVHKLLERGPYELVFRGPVYGRAATAGVAGA